MIGRREVLALAFVAFPALAAAAGDIRVEATLDRETAEVGGRVGLTVTVSGSFRGGGEPLLPELPDFDIFGAGRTQSWSLVNGRLSASVIHNYVLIPGKEGTYEIGPIRVERDDMVYRSRPLELRVEAPAPTGARTPRARSPSRSAPSAGRDRPRTGVGGRESLILATSVDRDTVYVNQEVILSVKFYRRVEPVGRPEYHPPSTTGFWVEDLGARQEYYEEVNGRDYLVAEVLTALFPTSPGEHIVGMAELRCQLRSERDPWAGDPFDVFRRGALDGFLGRLEEVTLRSGPLTVVVLPLPEEGRPEGFSGAVGDYSFRAELDREEIPAGEPVTLRVITEGRGNLKTVPAPEIPPLPGMRVYDSRDSLAVSKEGYHVSGTRVVEKLLVPAAAGRYSVPPLSLNFLDPENGYVTLYTDTLRLEVGPAMAASAAPGDGARPQEVELRGRDIRHVRAAPGRLIAGSPLGIPAGWAWGLQVVPLAAMGIAWGWQREIRRRERDPGYLRFRRAGREARRRLKEAEALARGGDYAGSQGRASRAVVGFLADRLELNTANLTPAEAQEILAARGIASGLAGEVRRCLEESDMARFAPGAGGEEPARELLHDTRRILRSLEKARLARAGGA